MTMTMTMSIITTSTRPPEAGERAVAPSRTVVGVELDTRGRVAVSTAVTAGPGRPCLRPMLLSSSSTTARVCLVPDGALLLGGDAIELAVTVGDGARLELVEPAGTVAYDMRGGHARWDIDIAVGEGGCLAWAGEPFVVSSGADVRRRTTMRVADRARLALRETLVLGRHGEQGGLLGQRVDISTEAGRPVLVEALRLDEVVALGVLGGRRVVSSVVALGLDLPSTVAPDRRYDLEDGGVWWRALGDEVHRTVPWEAWSAVLEASRG